MLLRFYSFSLQKKVMRDWKVYIEPREEEKKNNKTRKNNRAARTFMRASPSSVLVRAISELRQWSEQRCEDPVITSEQPTM
jgi:hypothetical protein